ncbi:MAG: thioesterase [Gracilibacter sp. BRH_c7a]|nr:MAG: thioesterase [Gracilibacter sp. BRH_c7a]
MRYKVTNKQYNSKMCFVCGLKNKSSLRASFYELENDEIVAIFRPLEEHQSYPERLHGGVAAAILDETIGRAINIKHSDVWGVTVELNLKYKKPVPLDEELRVIGRITRDTSRVFEGTGEILLSNGEPAVLAEAKYLKMSIDKIMDYDPNDKELLVLSQQQEDPSEIEY